MVAHKKYTLVLLRQGQKVLLGLKKRGFGKGKWNGFGGKVQAGESVLEAAHRELEEEAGISTGEFQEAGLLHFRFEGNPVMMEVHVFSFKDYSGVITESEEMKPAWFTLEEVPYKEMWADDEIWWPFFLRGEKFFGRFEYRGEDTITEHNITPAKDLSQFMLAQ